MNDSFCFVRGSTVSVKNMHIALYDKSDAFSTKDTRRDRKILLHKGEIAKIAGKINRQGYTLVPLKLYFKGGLVKIEVALCRGKHTYDKKQAIADRDVKRSVERDIKNAGF
jgi:SsrA-binding protein